MEQQLSELEEYTLQLASIEEELASSPDSATNDDLLTLKAELTDLINLLHQSLGLDVGEVQNNTDTSSQSEIKDSAVKKTVLVEDASNPPPLPETPVENNTLPPPPPPPQASSSPKIINPSTGLHPAHKVGDLVLAKWVKGDKQYHKAKVTAITGPTHNPLYTVRYYLPNDDKNKITEIVSLDLIKSAHSNDNGNSSARSSVKFFPALTNNNNNNKRSAETFDESIINTTGKTGNEKPKNNPPPFKKEKVLTSYQKQTQSLEKAANSWQSFAKTGSKKKGIKIGQNSMFRSPTDVNGKVGVIGSGRQMTKDAKRSKHIFSKDNGFLG